MQEDTKRLDIRFCTGCTDTAIRRTMGTIASELYCESCFEAYEMEMEVSRIKHTAVGLVGFVAAHMILITVIQGGA